MVRHVHRAPLDAYPPLCHILRCPTTLEPKLMCVVCVRLYCFLYMVWLQEYTGKGLWDCHVHRCGASCMFLACSGDHNKCPELLCVSGDLTVMSAVMCRARQNAHCTLHVTPSSLHVPSVHHCSVVGPNQMGSVFLFMGFVCVCVSRPVMCDLMICVG